MDPLIVLSKYLSGIYSSSGYSAFFFVFFRVSAFVAVAPFFGSKNAPNKIKGLYALMLTAYITPLVDVSNELVNFEMSATVVSALLQQIVIGFIIGLVFHGLFDVLRMAGQNISNATQLAFAQMVEPGSGLQSSVMGNVMHTLGQMYFLASFGLAFVIGVFFKSFYAMPISAEFMSGHSFFEVSLWMTHIFSFGLMLSIPSMGVGLLINAAMAIVTRSAPSLNIFSIGFPLVIISGVIALIQITPYMLHLFLVTSEQFLSIINKIGL
ncbi:flagellar biosynthetic protein FliR [Photobacterium leiognathi]|uniref:flagellar biosynthetic protein FliR n=1 Tax=Photobacterium leiognathi TaxID=553611 RepID=UPI001EE06FCD|nr:flagellar biosynthetic protein FliR [Photobacterium leiognathi]MCG3883692.1 flagellar biosynthetic protein FliR [Photobacterium leiognathi]